MKKTHRMKNTKSYPVTYKTSWRGTEITGLATKEVYELIRQEQQQKSLKQWFMILLVVVLSFIAPQASWLPCDLQWLKMLLKSFG